MTADDPRRTPSPAPPGFSTIAEQIGKTEEVVVLRDGPAPVVLAKSPRAVHEVLVRKEGLYAQAPHPFADIAPSYAPAGARLLGLKRGRDTDDLPAAVGRRFERFPLLEEGRFVAVEPLCKRWCAGLLLDLLWQARSPCLAEFVADVERFERREETFLPSRARFLREVFADAPGLRDLDPDDRPTQTAVIRTFLNGYNALAMALVWGLVVLGRRLELRRRLRREPEALPGVVTELLRLYPPAWVLARRLLHPEELRGRRLAAGTVVQVSPFVTHRDPQYWLDPDRFDPERSHAPRGPGETRYFPFGGGARICPSARWVPFLLGTLLEHCLERWDFEPADPAEPVPVGWISLHPEPSPKLDVRRR